MEMCICPPSPYCPLVESVLTCGVEVKFANNCAEGVRRWAVSQGVCSFGGLPLLHPPGSPHDDAGEDDECLLSDSHHCISSPVHIRQQLTPILKCGDCDIEKIALEGEGRISDRVQNLWGLLLNWSDHLRAADTIVLGKDHEIGSRCARSCMKRTLTRGFSQACHSQGVPVGVMLVAKLLESGILGSPRIGICAMGVYDSRKTRESC